MRLHRPSESQPSPERAHSGHTVLGGRSGEEELMQCEKGNPTKLVSDQQLSDSAPPALVTGQQIPVQTGCSYWGP